LADVSDATQAVQVHHGNVEATATFLPKRFGVTSGYTFPIEARDGECRVLAELVTKDRKDFGITGIGFGPSTDVRIISSEDDGKDPKSATQRVSSDGSFVSAAAHRRAGGVGAFVAAGAMCEVTLRYEFGRQAKGPLKTRSGLTWRAADGGSAIMSAAAADA
jgi:hypothetical protein